MCSKNFFIKYRTILSTEELLFEPVITEKSIRQIIHITIDTSTGYLKINNSSFFVYIYICIRDMRVIINLFNQSVD